MWTPWPVRSAPILALAALILGPIAGGRAEPVTHTVRIQAFTFAPARLEVKTGEAVVWINEDIVPHTATGTERPWDTGVLARGGRQSMTFVARGAFAYGCRFHPGMRGEIVVTAGPVDSPDSQPDAGPVR